MGGKRIVPGKSAVRTMPADYLKSDLFEPVVRYRGGRRNDTFGRTIMNALGRAPMAMRVLPAAGALGFELSQLMHHKAQPTQNTEQAA